MVFYSVNDMDTKHAHCSRMSYTLVSKCPYLWDRMELLSILTHMFPVVLSYHFFDTSSGLTATWKQMRRNKWLYFTFSWLLAEIWSEKVLLLNRTEFSPVHLLCSRWSMKVHIYIMLHNYIILTHCTDTHKNRRFLNIQVCDH